MKRVAYIKAFFGGLVVGLLSLSPLLHAEEICDFTSLQNAPSSSCFSCEILDNAPGIDSVRQALQRQLGMTERKFSAVRALLETSTSVSEQKAFRINQKLKVLNAVLKSNLGILQSMLDEVPLSVSMCNAPQAIFCSAIDYSSITAGILSVANVLNEDVLLELLAIQSQLKRENGEVFKHRLQRLRANRFLESITVSVSSLNTVHLQCGEAIF